jgi:hypothetical protein
MINTSIASVGRHTATERSMALRVLDVTLIVLLTAAAFGLTARSAGARNTRSAKPSAAAFAARALKAVDTAHLHYTSSSGSLLFEEGSASGTIPGKMRVHCEVGPTLTASFTIFVRGGGAIDGRGTAKAHGSGVYESFAGTLTVTGGSGRYAHARGHAGLYGVFDRRTYGLTVQTTGRLSY